MELLRFFLFLIVFLSLLVMVRAFIASKELNYVNPFFYFLAFNILYFGVPALFVEEIKFYYSWPFSDEDIVFSNVLVAILLIVSVFLFNIFRCVNLNSNLEEKASVIIKLIWFAILIYLIAVFVFKFKSGQLYFSTDYEGTKDVYKLKNIAYLLIVISVLYFAEKKSFYVFAPNLLVAVFDMLEGSRTTAFIALVPIFISLAIYNKKTYIVWVGVILAVMVVVGIFRNEIVSEQYAVPTHIAVLGEFRETYVLLPNLITNEAFVGEGSIGHIMSSIAMPFLQPLREDLLDNFEYSGAKAAKLVGRGYGLGNNFLVESIYYGYFFVLINIILVIPFLYTIYYMVKRVSLAQSIVLASYSVVFVRLIIREGFLANFTLMVFVFAIYALPFILLNKYFKIFLFKKHVGR